MGRLGVTELSRPVCTPVPMKTGLPPRPRHTRCLLLTPRRRPSVQGERQASPQSHGGGGSLHPKLFCSTSENCKSFDTDIHAHGRKTAFNTFGNIRVKKNHMLLMLLQAAAFKVDSVSLFSSLPDPSPGSLCSELHVLADGSRASGSRTGVRAGAAPGPAGRLAGSVMGSCLSPEEMRSRWRLQARQGQAVTAVQERVSRGSVQGALRGARWIVPGR